MRLLAQLIVSEDDITPANQGGTKKPKASKDRIIQTIELKQFIAIFEKDTFGERAIKAIKKNIQDKLIEKQKIEAQK